MSIRTVTGMIVAAALAAPIAANAHIMRFPHLHDGVGVPMTIRMDPRIALEAEIAARCLNGTAPTHLCAVRGY